MDILRGRMTFHEFITAFVVVPLYAMFTPLAPVAAAIVVLIVTDTILGVWASKRRGVPISSSRGWRAVSKIVMTFIVLFAMAALQSIFEKAFPITRDVFSWVNMAALGIAYLEGKSILENAHLIYGKAIFKILINKMDSQNVDKPKGDKNV